MKPPLSNLTAAPWSFIFGITANSVSSVNWSNVTATLQDDNTTKTLEPRSVKKQCPINKTKPSL